VWSSPVISLGCKPETPVQIGPPRGIMSKSRALKRLRALSSYHKVQKKIETLIRKAIIAAYEK